MGEFTVQLDELNLDVDYIEILDLAGRLMSRIDWNDHRQMTIHVQDLSSGVYFVRVFTPNGASTKRFSKE